MEKKYFDLNEPIIIGLSGKAGSGKTSVAENIVPKGSIDTTHHGAKWDHIFYALPLYELSSIKRTISGINAKNRQLYAIHDVLFDLYGGSALGNIPAYDQFVEKVHSIHGLAIEPEGIKPRSFMQRAGDLCREDFANCFADWAIYKIKSMHRSYLRNTEEQDLMPYVVIISDVRFANEADSILSQKNGLVVCFDASSQTLEDRLIKRDGKVLNPEQAAHKSEQEIEYIKTICSSVINTDNMSIEEQSYATMSAIGLEEKVNA